MKRSYSMMAAMMAATVLVSCEKDPAVQEEETVTFDVQIGAASATDTKTHYDGTAQIKWDADGEGLAVIEECQVSPKLSIYQVMETDDRTVISDDGLFARFMMQVKRNLELLHCRYTYWGIYPVENCLNVGQKISLRPQEVKVNLPSVQHPTRTSFDPSADLLISRSAQMSADNTLDFEFQRPISFVAMQLIGLVQGEEVKSVTISAPEAVLAGESTVDLMKLRSDFYSPDVTSAEHEIVLNYGRNEFITAADPEQDCIYFTAYTGKLTDFKITVTTDAAIYIKEVSGQDFQLQPNSKLNLRVNLLRGGERIEAAYRLLEDASDLVPGDEIIFVSRNRYGKTVAMGRPVFVENEEIWDGHEIKIYERKSAPVSITEDNVIMTLSDDVHTFQVKEGWSFYDTVSKGYLSIVGWDEDGLQTVNAKDSYGRCDWKLSVHKGKSVLRNRKDHDRYLVFDKESGRFTTDDEYEDDDLSPVRIYYRGSMK